MLDVNIHVITLRSMCARRLARCSHPAVHVISDTISDSDRCIKLVEKVKITDNYVSTPVVKHVRSVSHDILWVYVFCDPAVIVVTPNTITIQRICGIVTASQSSVMIAENKNTK